MIIDAEQLKRYLCLMGMISLIACSHAVWGQVAYGVGLMPRINVVVPVKGFGKWVNSVESRQSLWANTQAEPWQLNYVLTDFSSLLSWKTGASAALHAGYQLRLRDGEAIHRLIQRYTRSTSYDALRIGHRIGLDQTFAKETPTTFRLRYRITFEKPLNGEKVNAKEFYFKMENEYFVILQDKNLEPELRLVPQLGYEISKHQKIELGIDYRLAEFINSAAENDFWIRITWYTSLGR